VYLLFGNLDLKRRGMMDKREFINSVKAGALKGYADYKILPSITVAQAILESAWGNSELTRRANNLFGVKAFSDWEGKKITLETTEYYNGEKQIVYADFRAYNSLNESIEDHSKLLSYSRYKPLRECENYKDASQRIYECGYATDPKYPEKLIRIIEENKLYELDNFDGKVKDDKISRFQLLCNNLNIKDGEGCSLVVDNILGWRTKSCIIKLPVLKEGSKGPAVEFIQEVVNAIPVDGQLGPVTRQCVIAYQKDNRLKPDGIVGIETWTSIVTN
jgi:peptidoglycan hydrolase-like protein with peptidoglycan-binding domain